MLPASQDEPQEPAPPAAGWPPGTGSWQQALSEAVSDAAEMLRLLGLEDHPALQRRLSSAAASRFPLRVPRGFIARMRPGDPEDPLLLQVLPAGEELARVPGYVCDPLCETEEGVGAPRGVLHKYRSRALLVMVGACGVHCRYCFRRHYPYAERRLGLEWEEALDYLCRHSELDEVILSGGDPLSVPDPVLAELAARLDAIPHLERLRIHSRLPVVLPERIDARLFAWLERLRLRPVLVVHANHPHEIDGGVRQALRELRSRGILVLNQAVLLRGVNDRAGVLCRLSEVLFEADVLPYYLHLLDPVAGAAHFAVSEERASRLLWEVSSRLPGYLVPRLVRELPGEPAKVPIPVGPGRCS